jgi:3-methyladenine DNA glycosylase Tag
MALPILPDRGKRPAIPGKLRRRASRVKCRCNSFVGPTTVYAFMQAMGLVNDHIEGCHAGEIIRRLRRGR